MAALFDSSTPAPGPFDDGAADGHLAGLNPVQREATTHAEGPLLIVAGAGSGKTTVLTTRIAHLIQDRGISPFEILAITFTNKAADEMKHRVGALVGPVAEKMWVSTFHSACVRILRRDAHHLGYTSSFTIYDQADAVRLTSYVLRDQNVDAKKFPPRAVHAIISQAKNDLVSATQYAERARTIYEKRIAEVYTEYQLRLRAANAMDFDDLLVQTVELFRTCPEVLAHYQTRFKHLLVDEYQDTNAAQNEMVILLAKEHRNICVVGDSDQCLPPETIVRTTGGDKPIADVEVGDEVLGTLGSTTTRAGRVEHVKQGHYIGKLFEVRTASGAVLRGTPHHIVPADTSLPPEEWLVSLMHGIDRGWRVGVDGAEHADAVWVLRVCDSRAQASYWEAWYSATYGLPTARFHGVGRDLAMDEAWLAKLFASLDTDTAAKALMLDADLHPDLPHHRPQSGHRRRSLNFTMYGDRRSSGGPYHRVHWSSTRADLVDLVRSVPGWTVRPGRKGGWRVETSRKDYGQAIALARQLADVAGLEIRPRAMIDGKPYPFTPLSHLHPGMKVLVEQEGKLVEDVVTAVECDFYDGPVYDLEVDRTHTYVADGVLVHNSIYRFRGADIRNILEFENAFPDAHVIVLEQNYRSTQRILDAANAVIANNAMRKPKALWTEQVGGELITRYHAEDERDEAAYVVHEIGKLHDQEHHRWGDVAVFYRTNAQSRAVEEELARRGVPYKVVGGTRFYDRKEIKDLLGYLRAVTNPADEVSLKRIINVPKRGVGDTSLGRLDNWATARNVTFAEAMDHAAEAGVTGKALGGIRSVLDLLEDVRAVAADGSSPATILEVICDRTGYVAELEAERSVESAGRLENIAELISAARQYEAVAQFLEDVSLVADTDEVEADESSVILMTLHTAKGLEYPAVFLIGLEDGVFPHLRSLGEPDELEEERRLCYVGITRARDRLYLTNAWCRTLWGSTQYNPPSRFLKEIPEELMTIVEGGRRSAQRERQRGFGFGGGNRSGTGPGWGGGREAIAEAAYRAGQGGQTTPAKTKGAEQLGLKVGDDVVHGKFGEGVILDIKGEGDKAEATVRFPGVGEKVLLLAWAPLKKG
ncbi:MAG TPA: UvrD-helicase domain-containing protein [Acidimicrobiales bacterium]|nr:UvrD-helicase domain-containing protein [Acidimicrobiales bacterium]